MNLLRTRMSATAPRRWAFAHTGSDFPCTGLRSKQDVKRTSHGLAPSSDVWLMHAVYALFAIYATMSVVTVSCGNAVIDSGLICSGSPARPVSLCLPLRDRCFEHVSSTVDGASSHVDPREFLAQLSLFSLAHMQIAGYSLNARCASVAYLAQQWHYCRSRRQSLPVNRQ
jgi:hypothetical protein